MFAQPSLLKRLMFSILTLSFILWCTVLLFMINELKIFHDHFVAINLETTAQQQLSVVKEIPNEEAIAHYANENDRLQKNMYKKLSIYASQYYLQIWRGEKIIYSAADLPITKPLLSDLQHLTNVQPLREEKPWLAWSESTTNADITVRVLQSPPFGFSVSYRSVGFYLIPFLISVPFLFFPVWWAISRGLRPLNKIAAEIVTRTYANLSNISDTPYRELSPIVIAVNRLMEKINSRIQREQEFLHDAAHELKTPLAVIQLNSELLISTTDPLTQQMALDGIQKGVARATRTTHQLLASSRTDNHLYNREVSVIINLTQLLQDRLAQWMSLALQKNIEIELEAPCACELKVDLESITLLIDNLIDNAIKYSDNGSIIQVCLIKTPTTITLQISDQGCGIPEDYREKVFERFFRLNQKDSYGTGLGLSIVKRVVQQHAATIELSHNQEELRRGLRVIIKFSRHLL